MIDTIFIDGIDKTGKDLICKYCDLLDKRKYSFISRGILSNIAYSKIYHREYNYLFHHNSNELQVFLTVNYQDWKIRCKINDEPKIDFKNNNKIFNDTILEYENKTGDKVLKFCSSEMTPYKIALEIIKYIEIKNGEKLL